MKNRGYVLVTSLLFLSIISIIFTTILKIGENRINTLKNLEDQAQAEYIPESIINIIFGEYIDEIERFYEDNYGSLRRPMKLSFDFSSKYDAEIDSTIQRDPNFNYQKFIINVTSKYKGITTRCSASGDAINNIYFEKDGISLDEKNNLDTFKFYEPMILKKFKLVDENEIYTDGNRIIIKNSNTQDIVANFGNFEFISIINDGKLKTKDSISLKGIFINNGEIENEFDFNLRGLLIDFSKSSQNIIVKGSAAYFIKPKKVIYSYQDLDNIRYDLPKFFKFKLDKITISDLVN